MQDGSVPSGNSMAATVLIRLAKLTGRKEFMDAAEGTLRAALDLIKQSPVGTGQLLVALDMYLGPMPEIVIFGDPATSDTNQALQALRGRYLPNRVIACRATEDSGSATLSPLFQGKQSSSTGPTVYVCQDFTCQAPVTGADEIAAAWEQLG